VRRSKKSTGYAEPGSRSILEQYINRVKQRSIQSAVD
jgi:hypothetical protein